MDKIKVLFFNAPWCGQCHAFAPMLQAFGTEHDELNIVSVDTSTEAGQQLADEYNVMTLPTLVRVKDQFTITGIVGPDKLKELLTWKK